MKFHLSSFLQLNVFSNVSTGWDILHRYQYFEPHLGSQDPHRRGGETPTAHSDLGRRVREPWRHPAGYCPGGRYDEKNRKKYTVTQGIYMI